MRALIGIGTGLAGMAALIGVWFWHTENSYAAANPGSDLAQTLQWVGIALALIGIAGVMFGIALLRSDLFEPGDPGVRRR